MNSALDAIMERAACMVSDGYRNAENIIRECYDLEVGDWFTWELLQAVYSPSELLTATIEEGLIDYCINELEDEVGDLIDERVAQEEDEEEAENAYYDLGLDDEPQVGNRERDVFEHLTRVEHFDDNGHDLYRFFHKDGEHSCTWDETYRKFVG